MNGHAHAPHWLRVSNSMHFTRPILILDFHKTCKPSWWIALADDKTIMSVSTAESTPWFSYCFFRLNIYNFGRIHMFNVGGQWSERKKWIHAGRMFGDYHCDERQKTSNILTSSSQLSLIFDIVYLLTFLFLYLFYPISYSSDLTRGPERLIHCLALVYNFACNTHDEQRLRTTRRWPRSASKG